MRRQQGAWIRAAPSGQPRPGTGDRRRALARTADRHRAGARSGRRASPATIEAGRVLNAMRDRGVLVGTTGRAEQRAEGPPAARDHRRGGRGAGQHARSRARGAQPRPGRPPTGIVAGMELVLGVEGDGSHSHAVLTDASGTLLGFGANDDSSDWDQNGIAAAARRAAFMRHRGVEHRAAGGRRRRSIRLRAGGRRLPGRRATARGDPRGDRAWGSVPDRERLVRRVARRHGSSRSAPSSSRAPARSSAGRNRSGEEYRSLGLGWMYGDFGSETDVSEIAITAVADAFTGPRTADGVDEAPVRSGRDAVGRRSAGRGGAAPDRHDGLRPGRDARGRGRRRGGMWVARARGRGARPNGRARDRRPWAWSAPRSTWCCRARCSTGRPTISPPRLKACVNPVIPDARLNRLAMPPVVGSALMALDLAGRRPATDARSTLADGLAKALATR